MGRPALWLAAALFALAGSARGHGGGEARALRPVLDPLPAALAGMRVQLHDTLGAQLVLENRTRRTVEVLDERGVPFLRIGPRGVEGNLSAPAWYRTLGPASAVPASLPPGAAPRWARASPEPSYGWFDPRLASEGEASQESGRFEVPLRVDGERVALSGRFRSAPTEAGAFRARLTSPSEIAPGVRVTLLPGRAPGLLVENASGRALIVFGAEGEPFLRIASEGVDANLASPTWQASARSASAAVPAEGASGAPAWQRVASVPRFGWIEPRALVTRAPPEGGGDVLEWRVPMRLGDESVVVTGVVAWKPLATAHAHAER
jgi:hypothetical protein